MTDADLETLLLAHDAPGPGLPCMMLDGRVSLLLFFPGERESPRRYGFQVPGEEDIRWRTADQFGHYRNGALVELAPRTPEPPDRAQVAALQGYRFKLREHALGLGPAPALPDALRGADGAPLPWVQARLAEPGR